MILRIYPIGLAIAFLLTLPGCSTSVEEQRRDIAEDPSASIYLGVAWSGIGDANCSSPQRGGLFVHGICLALSELNEKEGGLNRKLEVLFRDDQEDVTTARVVAQSFVDDPRVMAVIGHAYSYLTVPAAPIYEFANIPLLAPAATSVKLTQSGYHQVFRTIPSDAHTGGQLARFVASKACGKTAEAGSSQKSDACKNALIYYEANDYGRSLATVFQEQLIANGSQVLDRVSFDEDLNSSVLQSQLKVWKRDFEKKADVIFIAGTMPVAGTIISMIRDQGWTEDQIRIVGGDGLYTRKLLELNSAQGTVVASPFFLNEKDVKSNAFHKKFYVRYGVEPDVWAAQAYDAVHLIAFAMLQGEAVQPSSVTDVLKNMNGTKNGYPCFEGVTGKHCFDNDGNVGSAKKAQLFQVRNKEFLPILR